MYCQGCDYTNSSLHKGDSDIKTSKMVFSMLHVACCTSHNNDHTQHGLLTAPARSHHHVVQAPQTSRHQQNVLAVDSPIALTPCRSSLAPLQHTLPAVKQRNGAGFKHEASHTATDSAGCNRSGKKVTRTQTMKMAHNGLVAQKNLACINVRQFPSGTVQAHKHTQKKHAHIPPPPHNP